MAQTTSTTSLSPNSFFQTTLSGGITSSDTTIPLNALPSGNEGYLVLESTSSTAREIIHYTSKTGSAVVCGGVGDRGLFGTSAQAHSSGALAEDNWVTGYWFDLQSMAATSSGSALQRHLANPTEGQFGNNFVSSGLGVTGISSSLVATLASGVAYVAGSRVVPSVGGHTYQAQADTFIDLKSDGTLTFAGGASGNSGASVPLTSSSVRVARVNTHASGINSVQQWGLSDLGGNILYPYPTTQVLLGTIADVTANQTDASLGTNVALTGFSLPVIIPGGKQSVVVHAVIPRIDATGATNVTVTLWDGAVGTGTQLTNQIIKLQDSGDNKPVVIAYRQTSPASGPKTYRLSINTDSNNTTALFSATSPGQMWAEVI